MRPINASHNAKSNLTWLYPLFSMRLINSGDNAKSNLSRRYPLLIAAALLLIVSCCAADSSIHGPELGDVPVFGYQIVNSYPHDPMAFTQGLVYDRDDVIYEGTGLYGRSSLRQVDLKTGRVMQQISLPGDLFGEGIALWEESIVQLTWQSGLGLVYGKENLTETGRFGYRTEGWGLTRDNHSLIMSDGSNILHILDPETFRESGRINVTAWGRPLNGLNELEYIKGEVYANIWPTSRIAIISPETGKVRGVIDLTGILPESQGFGEHVDVLNGIAYDVQSDRIFVTGKLWPRLYEIRLTDPENS
jgi:glutamine cyclotransferase